MKQSKNQELKEININFYKLYIQKGIYDKKFIPKTKIIVWDREGKKEEKNKTNC